MLIVKDKEVMSLRGSKGGVGGVERREGKQGSYTNIF